MLDSKKIAALMMVVLAVGGCAKNVPLGGGVSPAVSGVQVVEGAMPEPQLMTNVAGDPAYPIAPQDKLQIDVANLPGYERSIETVVDSNGRISLPLAGSIEAAGKTPRQIEETIRQQLRRNYVRSPKVSVNVLEIRSRLFSVDGEVREPGMYPLRPQMSLVRSISLARGLSENAKIEDVVLFRTVNGVRYAALYNLGAIRRGAYQDPRVYADDVIIVGRSPSRQLFKDLAQIVPTLGYLVVSLVK